MPRRLAAVETIQDRDQAVFEARASGRSVNDIVHEFGLTQKEIEKIVAAKSEELLSGATLRQSIALAAHRLECGEIKFHLRAMEGDGDAAAEMVAVKCNERRMAMLGGNAPLGHAVQISTAAAPAQETSTDYYRRVFDRLMGVPALPEDESDKPPN